MKRAICVAFAVATLAACVNETDATAAPGQLAVATNLVAALGRGDYEGASKGFNAEMRTALPKQKLEESWKMMLEKFGAPKHSVGVRATTADGYQIVYVKLQHHDGSLDVRVVFKDSNEVAGLWFRPSDDSKTYQAAPNLL